MSRDASPPELPSLERTALWVQAQASFAYSYTDSTPPPSPARSSTKTTSTYQTTTSSDEVSVKPSLTRSTSLMQHSTRAPSATTQRPRYDSRTKRSSLPFPQSPPGSGYPVQLEVAAPRRPESGDKKGPAPALRKQRRPSIIEQIISFGTPGLRRRQDSESSRKKT